MSQDYFNVNVMLTVWRILRGTATIRILSSSSDGTSHDSEHRTSKR